MAEQVIPIRFLYTNFNGTYQYKNIHDYNISIIC